MSLDGSALQIDQAANQAYYLGTGYSPNGVPPGQPVQLPPTTAKLLEQIVRYTNTPDAAAGRRRHARGPWHARGYGRAGRRTGRAGRHARAAATGGGRAETATLLDDNWKKYLAVPNSVAPGTPPPTLEELTETLTRFDTVAKDPRYVALTQRPEFRVVQDLLRQYLASRKSVSSAGSGLCPACCRSPPRKRVLPESDAPSSTLT